MPSFPRPNALASALLTVSLISTGVVNAELTLDPSASRVSLISYKVLADGTTSVSERHAFTDISGTVDSKGSAAVSIPLDSIETGIPIRNERMAEYLFKTSEFPSATIEAMVPADILNEGTHQLDLTTSLTLHGTTQEMSVPVAVHSTDATVTVTAVEPVLLDANAYNLAGGIGALAELAKLAHIPTTVPVSFSLTFNK